MDKGALEMKIGEEVYIHGYIDEIRKDCVIIRNEGGYFATDESELVQIHVSPLVEPKHIYVSPMDFMDCASSEVTNE